MRLPPPWPAAALLAALLARPAAAKDESLPAGRYAIPVEGLACAVCARAVAAEWSRLPGVEGAEVRFGRERAVLSVALGATVKLSSLRKALRRAEKVANMGARYELGPASYLPSPPAPSGN